MPMAKLEGPRHLIRYVNPAFCRFVAKSKGALIGKPFSVVVQKGDRCLAVLDRVYRRGEAENHTEMDSPKPHPAYWSYSVWRWMDSEQRPAGVVVQVTETTRFHEQAGAMNRELLVSSVRQHELREVSERLNEQLERLVEQRTLRLRALALELTRAEENERRRLAQVLHDQLQPLLIAARLTTESIARPSPVASPKSPDKVARQVGKILESALAESRALTFQLAPPVLHASGLSKALRWLGRSMEHTHQLSVAVKILAREGTFDETLSILLFQCARELLLNVVKHAGVPRATVVLRQCKGMLQLEVSDHGAGFDPVQAERAANAGFGLLGVRERIHLLGGKVEIRSAPGQGTTVLVNARLVSERSAPTALKKVRAILPHRLGAKR